MFTMTKSTRVIVEIELLCTLTVLERSAPRARAAVTLAEDDGALPSAAFAAIPRKLMASSSQDQQRQSQSIDFCARRIIEPPVHGDVGDFGDDSVSERFPHRDAHSARSLPRSGVPQPAFLNAGELQSTCRMISRLVLLENPRYAAARCGIPIAAGMHRPISRTRKSGSSLTIAPLPRVA